MFFICFMVVLIKLRQTQLCFQQDHIKTGFRYCICMVDTIYYKVSETYILEIITIIVRQEYPK